MARFGSYFGLCPLIDHRSLLGVHIDSEDDKVLVTLGKNIAMKYKLADQKQTLSWTTKEKFTSPVIFDFELQKYVAVFHQMYLRCWDDTSVNLDKVKKLKSKSTIHTLLNANKRSYIVFQNGEIKTLKEFLPEYKSLEVNNILDENEGITDIISCSVESDVYIGIIVTNSKTGENDYLMWTSFDLQGNRSDFSKILLKRNSTVDLVGMTFHLSDQIELLTLWSDGKLFVRSLEESDNKNNVIGELYAVIESLTCKYPVSMTSLDKDYIVMYGGNNNHEGALLVIYNMQFKVTQCRQPFKLLTVGAQLWPIRSNILLPVGQNLAVIPYHLQKEQLSALVGSHKMNQNTEGSDISFVQNLEEVLWSSNTSELINDINDDLKVILKEYLEQGLPENAVFQEIISKNIDSSDIKSLELLLRTFDDIPEKCFVELIQFFLEIPNDKFGDDSELHPDQSFPEYLQPYKRYEILTILLRKPINEITIVPLLRSRISLENNLKLLNFISFLLCENNNFDIDLTKKLIKWVCLILDANYQTFIFSKNEDILKILLTFSEFVNNELVCLEDLQRLFSAANQISKKKKICRIVERNYTVEKIDLS